MTEFDRQLYGFRFAETRRGDSLQIIAARELGDANRWAELITLNKLLPPFITDDPAQVATGVVLAGAQILVPAPVAVVTTTTNPEAVYEADVKMGAGGDLLTDGKDFVVVSGRGNLKQALKNRIETDRRELIYHPSYGCDARRLVGIVNGPTASLLGAQAVKASVQQDPRIDRVTAATAEVIGDTINVTAEAETVAGRSIQAQASP